MDDSRELFVEYGEMLLKGLESGVMEYDGKHYQQPPARHPPGARSRPSAAAPMPRR